MGKAADDGGAIDLAFLERQTFGDRTLERELLSLFAGQCRALLPTLAGPADAAARAEAAHRLKGAASAVGAVRVAELAGELERLLLARSAAAALAGTAAALGRAMGAAEQAAESDLRGAA